MDERLISFFYKWDRLERGNDLAIIDFDLLQQDKYYLGAFTSREEVKEHLGSILAEYNTLPQKNNVVYAKLEASLYFLHALMGKEIPFHEYISKTMGIFPKYIPEEILQQQLSDLRQAYEKVGYVWDKKGIDRFEEENILSKEEIEKSYTSFRDNLLPQFLKWLGLEVNLSYRVSFVDLDVYWMNWIDTDKNGEIHLQYNLNERHKWLKGSTEFLVLHEICSHAVQASLWKEQLHKGKFHPFLGLITVFTPEQFFMEGMAESLYYFYPANPFSDYGQISRLNDNLFWMVWNNAHIMANNGVESGKIVKFLQTYFPALSEEAIDKSIQEKTQEPIGRTYQYIYGISLYYHMLMADKMSIEQKRNYVIEMFQKLYTPTEILKRYNMI